MRVFAKVFVYTFFLLGCASGHCDRNGRAQKMDSSMQRIFVYKYDGSKQCETNTGMGLDEMSSELSGIKVFSMSKKNDGQIRVQVCGALTGMANVFEIGAKDLPKAEALGFKKWNF